MIALLTPSRDGRAHLDHSEAIAATRIEALRRGVPLKRYVGKGSSNLPRNRNLLAAQALKDGAEVLLWIDCDIAFDPADVFKLADSPHDVVAALPQARSHQWGEKARIAGVVARKCEADGLMKAQSLPTAFMAIKRHVLERMADEGVAKKFIHRGAHESLWPHLHNWFFYELRNADAPHEGQLEDDAEDYYFCRKWREIGGELRADPDVRLHHFEGLVRHSLCLADTFGGDDGDSR